VCVCVCVWTNLLLIHDLVPHLEDGWVLHHDAFAHVLHFLQQLRVVPAVGEEKCPAVIIIILFECFRSKNVKALLHILVGFYSFLS